MIWARLDTEMSFHGDANRSRERAPDDRLRIEPGMTS
jgi:hypothetical protein